MTVTEEILVLPHTGLVPVHGSAGNVLTTVERDTGLKRVYLRLVENGKQIAGQQIGFLHPNGYMHFIIPTPPKEFVDRVKAEVERQSQETVVRVGAPPPIESEDE